MTKKELTEALLLIEKEKNISKEVLIKAIEEVILTAYHKTEAREKIKVKVDPTTFDIKIFINNRETNLEDLGRAQVTYIKQKFFKKLKEIEYDMLYTEFRQRINDVITGVVHSIGKNAVYIELGKIEGILPFSEKIPREMFSIGMKAKFYILDVKKYQNSFQVILSRAATGFVKRLFELEIPEISEGIVKIVGIVREAGSRCKIAVVSEDKNVDPVGACIGLKGTRIQTITNELRGEKIDIVNYNSSITEFIKNALLPAEVKKVEINEKDRQAITYVPKDQLSLAIGKDGQNVRLAVKLTGWNIDIKPLNEKKNK
jgi:N utilization substance protein A